MSNTFAELGLNEQILAGVDALGFTTPTPVQAQAIPAVLEGRDVVASAQTGTGKTAAFALPVLQNILAASIQARQELVANDNDEPTEGPDVLADAAPNGDSLSIPAPTSKDDAPAGDKPKPRRRRRRHHRKITDNEAAASQSGTPLDATSPSAAKEPADTASRDKKPAGTKAARKRRSRKPAAAVASQGAKSAGNGADPNTDATGARTTGVEDDTRKPGTTGAKDTDTDGPTQQKPKRRRKRRRKKAAPQTDSRAKNPDARPFGPFALVVTPTRELAQQIDNVVSVVCEHTGQRAVIVMGGAKFDRQIRSLEAGCDMLVATPGRLIDLMEHDHVDLSHVQVLVLDEADRMLDMGFWPSVRRIVAALPDRRQNLLFSATIPPSIQSTIDAMLHDPVHVEIARVGQTADTVEEHLCPVTQGQKTQLLKELVRTGGAGQAAALERVLVFCRTKQRVDDVSRTLKSAGLSVDVMHADRPQKARERALEKFRAGTCKILLATDVMSRGIDVSGIDAVVNFDVPLDPEDYVHRIGRTGRAGATGHAYTFVAPDEISPLREIEYFTGKLIPTWDLPDFAYDSGRIVPGATRSTVKPKRTMFSGTKSRGFGMSAGRYGRHY